MKQEWFKHYCSAGMDPRMKRLLEKHGYFGIGVYWTIVERIMVWGDGCYPREDLVKGLRGPRLKSSVITSVLDDFLLFEENEFGHLHLSPFMLGTLPPDLRNWQDVKSLGLGQNHVLTHVKMSLKTVNQGAHAKEEKREKEKEEEKEETVVPDEVAWMKYVEPLKDELTEWHDAVCARSGYGTLLRRRWQEAIVDFVEHIKGFDQGRSIQTTHDARYYFANFSRISSSSGRALYKRLEELDEREMKERQCSDPLRFELVIDGVRYAGGRMIPDSAPPRPSSVSVWDDATEKWVDPI